MSSCYFEGDNSYKDDSQGYSFCFGGPLAPKMIVNTFKKKKKFENTFG